MHQIDIRKLTFTYQIDLELTFTHQIDEMVIELYQHITHKCCTISFKGFISLPKWMLSQLKKVLHIAYYRNFLN